MQNVESSTQANVRVVVLHATVVANRVISWETAQWLVGVVVLHATVVANKVISWETAQWLVRVASPL